MELAFLCVRITINIERRIIRNLQALGVKEHIIFPEIDIDKVNRILGMDITFVTSAESDEEAKALLDAFGFPFIKK